MHHGKQKIQKNIIRHHTFQHQRHLQIRKKIFILGDSMAKHIQGWDISSNLHSKHKVYVRSFSSAKLSPWRIIHALKKTSHLILDVGTNDLVAENNTERIAKSIDDLAKGLVADDRTISVSGIVPRNNKLNGKVTEVNSYLERICSNVNMHFIDNARVINPKRHLNNGCTYIWKVQQNCVIYL